MDMLVALAETVFLAFVLGAIVGAVVALHLRGVRADQTTDAESLKSNKGNL
ncbi:MAG: hypothetical protein AABY83_06415 [Pseudomonadota bacterium]